MAINKNINDDITLAYLLKKVKTDVLSALNTAVEKIYVALGNKVEKSGDTMTGHLTLSAGNEMRVRAGFKSNGTYSSNRYALQYRLDDSEGTCIGLLRSVHYSGGNEALDLLLWRKVNGADVYNTLQLAITPNGGRVVTVTEPAIWRTAIGAVNKAGDTMTGGLNIETPSAPTLYMYNKAADISLATDTASRYWSFYQRDKNGKIICYLESSFNTAGLARTTLSVRRIVNGSNTDNAIVLNVAADGTRTISVSSPTAWRNALNLGSIATVASPVPIANGGSGQTGITTTTTAANIITAASGITIIDASYAQWGKVAQIFVRWKSANAVSVTASGNATNVTVGTIASGKRPAIASTGKSFGDGAGPAFYYLETGGTLKLCACGGTGSSRTIAAGAEFYCGATYLLP